MQSVIGLKYLSRGFWDKDTLLNQVSMRGLQKELTSLIPNSLFGCFFFKKTFDLINFVDWKMCLCNLLH